MASLRFLARVSLLAATSGPILAAEPGGAAEPASDAPASDAPASDAPASDAPASDAPASDPPASEPTASDSPEGADADHEERALGADESADSLRSVDETAAWTPAFRPYLGVAVGLALPLGALGLSPTAGVEVGAELPWLGGRVLPAVGLSGLMPGAAGTVAPPDAAAWDWRYEERQLAVQPGLRVRLAPPAGRLQAEAKAGAGLALGVETMAVGASTDARSQVVEELRTWVVHGGAAVGARAGRNLVLGEAYWTGHRLDSTLAGTAFPSHLVVGVGVRHDL